MMLFFTPTATPPHSRTAPPSPPKSPPSVSTIIAKLRQQSKAQLTKLCSGPPQTHPPLSEDGVTSKARVPIEQRDLFVCAGAVDVSKLLRGSRSTLLGKAMTFGANCLVDEHWTCTIRRCKSRPTDIFRVQIRYIALATRATHPDPNQPVALDKARGHSGLMTILMRE